MSNKDYERKLPPKKSLGQHFLKDTSIAIDIAETIKYNGLPVLEVGPGTGALTEHLLKRFKEKLYVAEIDTRSIAYLKKAFPSLEDRILEQDVLQLNLPKYFPQGVNIIGNFPYNISSQLLIKVLDNAELVPQFAGMFQKEVAQRICAEKGNKQYGQLTLQREIEYNATYLFDVPNYAFDPPPKVVSGVIAMEYAPKQLEDVSKKQLIAIIKAAFHQRRKMLRNSLKSYFTDEQLATEQFTLRPDQLELNDFIELATKAQF